MIAVDGVVRAVGTYPGLVTKDLRAVLGGNPSEVLRVIAQAEAGGGVHTHPVKVRQGQAKCYFAGPEVVGCHADLKEADVLRVSEGEVKVMRARLRAGKTPLPPSRMPTSHPENSNPPEPPNEVLPRKSPALDDALTTRAADLARAGVKRPGIRRSLGVIEGTWSGWLQEGQRVRQGEPGREACACLLDELEKAEQEAERNLLGSIITSASRGDWKAAAWLLPRLNADYDPARRVEVTGQVELASDPRWQLVQTTLVETLNEFPMLKAAFTARLAQKMAASAAALPGGNGQLIDALPVVALLPATTEDAGEDDGHDA